MNLNEKDFEVLRLPLESGRQSPENLSGNLFLSVFLLAGLFALEYFVAASSTIHPWKEEILNTHFWFTLALCVLSLIYSIPFIYRKSERIQYLLSILVSQNLFGSTFYIMALFFIGKEGSKATPESLKLFTLGTVFFGFLVFALTFLRLYRKLRNGDYRIGSRQDELRNDFEYKSYLPIATVAGIGFFFVLQYVFRMLGGAAWESMSIIVFGFSLFYVMMFILPEQIVILYCKFRYKSFNLYGRTFFIQGKDSQT